MGRQYYPHLSDKGNKYSIHCLTPTWHSQKRQNWALTRGLTPRAQIFSICCFLGWEKTKPIHYSYETNFL